MSSLRWHDHTALMAHISVWQTPIPQDDSDDLSPPSQTSPPRGTPARPLGTTFVLPLWHLDACFLKRIRHLAKRLRWPLSSQKNLYMNNGTSLARALLFTLVVLHRIPCDKRNCTSAGRKFVPRSCAEDQTALRQDENVFQDGIRQKINGGRAVPSASRTPPASDTAPHIPLYPIPSPCRYENLVARQPGCRTTCILMSWTYMRSSHGVVLTPWRSSYSTHVVQIHSRRGTFG